MAHRSILKLRYEENSSDCDAGSKIKNVLRELRLVKMSNEFCTENGRRVL